MASWTVTQPQQVDLEDEVRRLDVSLMAGRLSIVGTDGPARLEVSRIGEEPLTVTLEDGVLRVTHPYPSRMWPGPLRAVWWWLYASRRQQTDVSIAVPVTTPGSLRVTAGSVVVSGIHADLLVDCVSGRITLLGNDGRIRAKVVSGPIEALGCAGEVALESVSGEITLADSATVRLYARTISGALTADLDNPPRDSDIYLETVSGEITIRVREDSDLMVRLLATSGRVTNAFPALAADAAWSRGPGNRWDKSVHGVLGAGTGKLYANATSGNIALLCRPVDDEFDAS